MKTLLVLSCMVALVASLNACNRDSIDADTDGAARTAGVASTSATGGPRSLTTVATSSLPAAITTYITTNYAGATIKEAWKDAAGRYVVAITVNNTAKVLLFKADGTFEKALDAKPKHTPRDSTNRPKHTPRDSTNRPKHAPGDTTHRPKSGQGPAVTEVDVAKLPATITAYINTNYAGATINKAVQETKSGNYVVAITTADKKRVALLFGSDGTFKGASRGK